MTVHHRFAGPSSSLIKFFPVCHVKVDCKARLMVKFISTLSESKVTVVTKPAMSWLDDQLCRPLSAACFYHKMIQNSTNQKSLMR